MMMKRIGIIISLFTMCICLCASGQASDVADRAGVEAWINANIGQEKAPFSFIYNGAPSADFLTSWRCDTLTMPEQDGKTSFSVKFSDPDSSLSIRCECVRYANFPALEWTVYFKNNGKDDTPLIEDIRALDAAVCPDGHNKLLYWRGSHERPSDFEPLEREFSEPFELAPYGGRSSDEVSPFFNIASPEKSGVILGVGWTGQWSARFSKADAAIKVSAGMEKTHFILHAGEEIRTPAILLLFWKGGDSTDGSNLFRRLLLKHYTPRPGGRDIVPPIAASPNATIGFTDTTEESMVRGIANLAEHHAPIDTWWLDAGWHGDDKNWAKNTGSWTPCAARFPNGLKPVGDAAHANGMRFLLWCEPERVMRGTWLFENHRDWLFSPADLPKELKYQDNDGFYLLNLGNPKALNWVKRTFSDIITKFGVDIYRQDFNMTPLYFWRNGEAENRQGINEIRHITGLYDLFDTLVKEHPGLMLDNCASGGRRIDFEIMRRALSLFRSDCCWDPIGEQCMNYGISSWMPVTGVGGITTDPYALRSGMGSHLSLALDFYNNPDTWPKLDAAIKQYKEIRPLFTGDFYPLTPYSLEKDKWIAWQYQSPERREGIIQAFRREANTTDSTHVVPRGLNPKASYIIENLDTNEHETRTGAALMSEGLDIRIPTAPGSALLRLKE
jgi:alpha-galactosidase